MEETSTQPAVETMTPAAEIESESVKNASAVLEKNKQLLNELRATREKAKELEAWKADLEMKEKEQQGKHTEVIASLREQLKSVTDEREADKKAASFNKFTSQIKAQAKEQGCVNPESLMKLMTKEQMASVEVDDKFNVNVDDTARLLETLKAEHDYLFTGKRANINNVSSGFKTTPQKDFKSMSAEEMKAYILNN